jgi:hypothetical protein
MTQRRRPLQLLSSKQRSRDAGRNFPRAARRRARRSWIIVKIVTELKQVIYVKG